MTISPDDHQPARIPESLISFIHTDDSNATDCDNDCRQRATYELLLHIADDSTDDSNTTVEYTCDDHMHYYLDHLDPNTALTQLRSTYFTSILRRHTDEDLADVLHTMLSTNEDDPRFLTYLGNALHATNIIRSDDTESPTI